MRTTIASKTVEGIPMPSKKRCTLASRAALVPCLIVGLSVWAAASGADAPASAGHRLTAEELLTQFRSQDGGGSFAWIGKSHRIVATMEDPADTNLPRIVVVDADSATRVNLASGFSPHPSPDGAQIAFISGRIDASGRLVDRQISVVPTDGSSEPRQVTNHPGGFSRMDVTAFAWSADGTRIAIPASSQESRRARGDAATKLASVEVHYTDRTQSQSTTLWVFDTKTGQGKEIASFPGDYILSTQWTSSGKILCVPTQGLAGIADIVLVDPDTGKSDLLLHCVNRQGLSPVLSPDQKTIALNYDPDPTSARYPYHHEIALTPAKGGTPRMLTHGFTASSGVRWDPTGEGLWVIGYDTSNLEGPGRRIFKVSLATGKAAPITPATESARGVAPAADGQIIAYVGRQFNGLSSLYVANRDGGKRREVLKLTPKGERLDLGRVRPVTWTSYDGTKLYGILYLPSTGDARNLPMIVDIHGGPVKGTDNVKGPLLFTTPFERSFWTGLGYAVFAVDYRQSTTYGWDKVTEARKAHENYDRDAADIVSGVNSLVEAGIADPGRIVAIGHSYGSCEINWLVTRPNPFAAAISYEGCGAPVVEFAASSLDGDNGSYIWTYDGYPWTNPESYRKQAATTYAAQIHTPTLFLAASLGIGRFAEGHILPLPQPLDA